jgi:KDO2-lipid IV(A) lauroyltransferase
MSNEGVRKILEVKGTNALKGIEADGRLSNRVLAGGHFGNFELATRIGAVIPGYRALATYRGIKPARVNDLLIKMRTVSGNLVFDRRTGADDLKRAMAQGGLLLTLAVDQADRSGGVELPFMGYYAWTTRSPVILAMRYKCALFVPICYRVGLAQWTVEIGDPIRMEENGKRRAVEDILRDINVKLEIAVRRDPANWFWVHNRWKTKDGKPPRAAAS